MTHTSSTIGSARADYPRHRLAGALAVLVTAALVMIPLSVRGSGAASAASAAQPPVGLGTASSFAVLAGTTVTNTGPSLISGDLGVSPGTAITGFPPGSVINGTQHAADAVALQAQSDLTTAYNDAAGRTPVNTVSTDLGGQTLVAGVYKAASSMGLTGTVTLDGENDPGAVFIFQAGSTLITASSSTVNLVRGAQACNVYWQVGSSATLGTGNAFVGTVMALTSVTVQTGTVVAGRVLARNGQVSLDTNTISRPFCAATPTPTKTVTATTTATATSTATTTATTTLTRIPATASTDTSTATSGGTAGDETGPDNTGGPGGPGGTDTEAIPTGRPDTGSGPSGSGDGWLVAAGILALAGGAVAAAGVIRRRLPRSQPAKGLHE
jgi:Tfp pilus assembly major pilin PilA